MKPKSANQFLANLTRLRESLNIVSDDVSRSDALAALDDIINSLCRVRESLASAEVANKASSVKPAIDHLLEFFEASKTDKQLSSLLAVILNGERKPKREPLKIATDLTNSQIRDLLEKELSAKELQIIAKQRGISHQGANIPNLRQEILANLSRQEDYERLASK